MICTWYRSTTTKQDDTELKQADTTFICENMLFWTSSHRYRDDDSANASLIRKSYYHQELISGVPPRIIHAELTGPLSRRRTQFESDRFAKSSGSKVKYLEDPQEKIKNS